jgi:glucokinase
LETPSGVSARQFLGVIAARVNEWKKEFGGKVTLGIGLPGDVDGEKGILRFAPNLLAKGGYRVKNLKVADEMFALTGVRAKVLNDAHAAALGAYARRPRGKSKNVLAVTLGTGVGGGVIIDGALYPGSDGCAGEIGHTRVDISPSAPLCGCGARGCLEAFVGTYGIKRAVKEIIKKYPRSILAKEVKKAGDFKIELVFNAADKGCAAAKKVWSGVGFYLGEGLADAALLLNIDTVILTGGVSGGYKFFKRAMQESFDARRIRTPFKKLKVTVSRYADSGAAGAALYSMPVKKNGQI